jgi:hypothetical protein
MTGLPPQVNSLSFHLVQKTPVRLPSSGPMDPVRRAGIAEMAGFVSHALSADLRSVLIAFTPA